MFTRIFTNLNLFWNHMWWLLSILNEYTVQCGGNVTCLTRSSLRFSEDPPRQIYKTETHRTKKWVIARHTTLQVIYFLNASNAKCVSPNESCVTSLTVWLGGFLLTLRLDLVRQVMLPPNCTISTYSMYRCCVLLIACN
mgnify:CR=1 FL=1